MRLATLFLAVIAFGSVSHVVPAQALPASDLRKISATLAGKTLPLRGYPWADLIGYRTTDGHLVPWSPGPFELSVFSLKEVKQRNGYLELHGLRKLYVRNASTQLVASTQISLPVVLVIYLGDVPDIPTLSDRLEEELFFPSVEDAITSIPAWQQACVPGVFSPDTKAVLPPGECYPPQAATHTTPPRLIKQVDPAIPDGFRSLNASTWRVMVFCKVTEKGIPEDVHVGIPSYLSLSSGDVRGERVANDLDNNAILAVRQYRFNPALRDGKPMPIDLKVVVNYTK